MAQSIFFGKQPIKMARFKKFLQSPFRRLSAAEKCVRSILRFGLCHGSGVTKASALTLCLFWRVSRHAYDAIM